MRTAIRLALAAMIIVVGANEDLFAQTVQLYCPNSGTPDGGLITIDYTTRTLTFDAVDHAGNITKMVYNNIPAEITDDKVTATWTERGDWQRFTLNRYTGIMTSTGSFGGSSGGPAYSKPCVPYQRGQRKF
jgi:hypothetical protein